MPQDDYAARMRAWNQRNAWPRPMQQPEEGPMPQQDQPAFGGEDPEMAAPAPQVQPTAAETQRGVQGGYLGGGAAGGQPGGQQGPPLPGSPMERLQGGMVRMRGGPDGSVVMPQADAPSYKQRFMGGGSPPTPPQQSGNGMDTRNLLIQALGGNNYSQDIPSMGLAGQNGVSPEMYQRMVQSVIGGPESQTQAQARMGNMAIQAAQTFGTPGVPGSVQNAATSVSQQGRAADLMHGPDAQNAAAFQQFVQGRAAAGTSMTDAMREWQESGMRLPQFAGGAPTSTSAFGGGAAAGGQAGGAPAQLGGGAMPVSPRSTLDNTYRQVAQRQGQPGLPGQPPRITDPNSAITDFVTSLGEGFVSSNAPAVMQFILEKFGGPAADAWFTRRFSTVGTSGPQERAIQMIQNAANAIRPGTVGNSRLNPQTTGVAGFGVLGR